MSFGIEFCLLKKHLFGSASNSFRPLGMLYHPNDNSPEPERNYEDGHGGTDRQNNANKGQIVQAPR